MVSLKAEEKRLLIQLSKPIGFYINSYSDSRKIPRSTTRSRLKKLDRLGLVSYKFANVKILRKGLIYLENTNQIEKQGDESSRIGGRENDLSVHWHKFTLERKDRKTFRKEKLDFLNCTWIENKGMNNWSEVIAKFNDATVRITPRKLKIDLYDIVKKDTDEVDAICLRRLIDYVELFKSLGLEVEGISLERGHWARIESSLGKWLYEKFEDKYELTLEDGSKFFIDFSPDKFGNRKLEEETDSKQVRQNIDKAMNGLGLGKYDLDNLNTNTDDISEIRKALGSISSMEKVRLMDRIEENKLRRLELEKNKLEYNPIKGYRPSYIK
jgi:hypothetical protein